MNHRLRKKVIDGQLHKMCSGPAHEEPVWLPLTEKYFVSYKSGPRKGSFLSQCRLCYNWSKLKSPGSLTGWISADSVRKYYIELDNRIGIAEMSRRTGITEETLSNVILGRTKNVQKAKLRIVMLELISARRKGEWVKSSMVKHKLKRRMKLIASQRRNQLGNEEKSLRASYH